MTKRKIHSQETILYYCSMAFCIPNSRSIFNFKI